MAYTGEINSYFVYRGHSAFVVAMSWSPDGSRIASGGVDTTVQVWRASDDDTVRIWQAV